MQFNQARTSNHSFLLFFNNQDGSILAIAMLTLLLLSIFGTFALNTTEYEISIAANQQQWEVNFNISEGGTTKEGYGVGYAGVLDSNTNTTISPWYQVIEPQILNTPLFPKTTIDFDPSGNDTPVGKDWTDFDKDDPNLWPRQNLMNDPSDNTQDYAYKVTYQYFDTVSKGTDATSFAEFNFRINGQQQVAVEVGGSKIGPKPL